MGAYLQDSDIADLSKQNKYGYTPIMKPMTLPCRQLLCRLQITVRSRFQTPPRRTITDP
jgi:hypothetical protein